MSKKRFIGQCHLCQTTRALVDSHIIPNFHYKPLKAREGHFYVIPSNPQKSEFKSQRGFTERLFCEECDTVRLQKNEDHLAKVVFGTYPLIWSDHGQFGVVQGLDYRKTKAGLLSILWRMSLASDDFFKNVDLGPAEEERIRTIIWNEEIIPEEKYPIILTIPMLQDAVYHDWIFPPDRISFGKNTAYRCLLSGYLFTFVIGTSRNPEILRYGSLRADGSWMIEGVSIWEIPFLKEACIELQKARNLRRMA